MRDLTLEDGVGYLAAIAMVAHQELTGEQGPKALLIRAARFALFRESKRNPYEFPRVLSHAYMIDFMMRRNGLKPAAATQRVVEISGADKIYDIFNQMSNYCERHGV